MEQQSSSNHIDKSVIVILLATILVAAVVVSFKAFNREPCELVSFDIKANQYRVGEIIRFKDYTDNVTEREWSFGDDTEHRFIDNPFHTYTDPGTYTVQLLVNGKCDARKEIVIKDKINVIDSTRLASFNIPKTIKVGELLRAKDNTLKATSWEWRFGETSQVNSTFQNPTYTYESEGLKTVTLIVNGDPRYSSQKKITVLAEDETEDSKKPKAKKSIRDISRKRESLIKYNPVVTNSIPGGPSIGDKPADNKPKAKLISRTTFAKMVEQIADEEITAKEFKPFMCGNLQISTVARGKKMTFLEFCEKIKGKNIKIKSLELIKNEQTKCIEYVSIDYSKSFF